MIDCRRWSNLTGYFFLKDLICVGLNLVLVLVLGFFVLLVCVCFAFVLVSYFLNHFWTTPPPSSFQDSPFLHHVKIHAVLSSSFFTLSYPFLPSTAQHPPLSLRAERTLRRKFSREFRYDCTDIC